MSERGREAVRPDDEVAATSEVRRLEERVQELERLLGRKTMGVRSSKRRSTWRRQKTDLAVVLAAAGKYPVKVVSAKLGVARSPTGPELDAVTPPC